MTESIVVDSANLIDRLYSNHLTVWYTLFALNCFADLKDRNNVEIIQKGSPVKFSKMLNEHLVIPEIEDTVKSLAITSVCRTYMRENFRITQNYCIETNKLDILQEQEWYQFARILVNCISHNFIFDLTTVNKNRLPVRFKNIEIGESMHGCHLSRRFTAQIFLDLGDSILTFVAVNNLGAEFKKEQ